MNEAADPLTADITSWLAELRSGADGASAVTNRLYEELYGELHRLARSHMRRDNDGGASHTLSATGLVHEALMAFEKIDARAAKVVELSFFGGLELVEIGLALSASLATVKRDWTVARAWLRRELGGASSMGAVSD